MTPAEKILWQELRRNKLGVHFRRQQVIVGFIVDFYCHKAGLVVEVDGDIHDLQQEEDARREKVLSEMGLRIVRFGNEEVMRDLSAVVGKVRELVGGMRNSPVSCPCVEEGFMRSPLWVVLPARNARPDVGFK
jgi:very-short-patch-repair endonuclease